MSTDPSAAAAASELRARLAPDHGLLGPDDHDQIAHPYGPNQERLCAAKARFDPYGIFSATPGAPSQDMTVPVGKQGLLARRG